MITAFIDWLLYRNRRTMTGIYDHGRIYPHLIHPPVVVGARVARRLQPADRVEFEVSPRTGEARRVRVYRKAGPLVVGQWAIRGPAHRILVWAKPMSARSAGRHERKSRGQDDEG
jgi:hypothetical protein